MAWAICGASRPVTVTWAGEAARPLVPSKHFPPVAGGTGGIHCERMKHDRHVSTFRLPQGGIHTLPRRMRRWGAQRSGELQRRIGRADQCGGASKLCGRKGAMDGASGAVAEPVARVPGVSQSCGLRVCPLAGSLARGRVKFRRDGRAHKRSREPAGAD
jgi:hypothetical protein